MANIGDELNDRNDKILKFIRELKLQRDEINYLINKQEEERYRLQAEIQRITYKIALINKSLLQRRKAKERYDLTIKEAEEQYTKILTTTEQLLRLVSKDFVRLESEMNKSVGTENANVNANTNANTNVNGNANTNVVSIMKTDPYDNVIARPSMDTTDYTSTPNSMDTEKHLKE